MAQDYHHGMRVVEANEGTRTLTTVRPAIVVRVRTGDDADASMFHLNKPLLVTELLIASGKAGEHARTSRYLSENTKERYHQCTNINCSCTIVTMESIERFIVTSGKVDRAPPHPGRGGQQTMWL